MFSAVLDLIRWRAPIGTWLLFWPCFFAAVLVGMRGESAAFSDCFTMWWDGQMALTGRGGMVECSTGTLDSEPRFPPIGILVVFFVGSFLMRSAGCAFNDFFDRHIDSNITRTKTRPLATGALEPWHAIAVGILFLVLAAGVLFVFLPSPAHYVAYAGVALALLYPLAKRITWWPQAVLGVAFSWGVPMIWATFQTWPQFQDILLLLGCMFWVMGYDTIYALSDRQDDLRIGVKSIATRLSTRGSLIFVTVCHVLAAVLWFAAAATLVRHDTGMLVLSLACVIVLGSFIWNAASTAVGYKTPRRITWIVSVFRSNHRIAMLYGTALLVNALPPSTIHAMSNATKGLFQAVVQSFEWGI